MIKIENVKSEGDYKTLLHIESLICNVESNSWHMHFGGIGFDRYFFGNGKNDIFEYGKILYYNDQPIGYSLVYADDLQYVLWLLPEWKNHTITTIPLIENLFTKGHIIRTNCNDEELCRQMKSIGYHENGESRFTAFIDLQTFEQPQIFWNEVEIRMFQNEDINERIKYSSLPTGKAISEKMYLDYMLSEDSKNVADYVVVETNTGKMVGYYSWWMDRASKTVMLNPVACIDSYRRRGISKHAILNGLTQMKNKGFSYAYVDTSTSNIAAMALYKSVGFKQCKKTIELRKTIN